MTHHSEYHSIINIKARAWHDKKPTDFKLTGQKARTLLALIEARGDGITAAEVSSWAYRLAAYVHEIKNTCNLDIETKHEEHRGGWHGRYFLNTPVEVLSIFGGD